MKKAKYTNLSEVVKETVDLTLHDKVRMDLNLNMDVLKEAIQKKKLEEQSKLPNQYTGKNVLYIDPKTGFICSSFADLKPQDNPL